MAYDILVVDDEKDIRELISGILSDEGYETRLAVDGISAIEQIEARQPHLVVLDVWLGDSEHDGLNVLEQIKKNNPNVPVIMISGHSTISTAVSAIKKGAYDFLEKPFQVDKLLITVDRAIESSKLKRENSELKKFVDPNISLLGTSQYASKLKSELDKAASNNWRVFLTGPSGSGKELLAKEIHDRSSRKDQPFIVVNCAHILPQELETEIFGLEINEQDNSFKIRRIGLIEQAHQGTIYFHEIAAVPLPTQAKITKMLAEEQFTRLGSQQKIKVNVRFMAGTSEKNMQELIQNGHFREDLFYRLNVLPIHIPNLKDRTIDIKVMVQTLCQQYAERTGAPRRSFSEDAILALQIYSWPHNTAELKNIVEWTLISLHNKSDVIVTQEMLPTDFLQSNSDNKNLKSADVVSLPIKEAREIFEKEYIQTQIARFSGNITQTAKFIGMERSALHRKMRILGLDQKDTDD